MDVILAGMTTAGLVVALVQGAKMLGMADKYAPWLALALSIAGALGTQLIVVYPQFEAWAVALMGGLIVWLTATGIYHASDNIVSSIKKRNGGQ